MIQIPHSDNRPLHTVISVIFLFFTRHSITRRITRSDLALECFPFTSPQRNWSDLALDFLSSHYGGAIASRSTSHTEIFLSRIDTSTVFSLARILLHSNSYDHPQNPVPISETINIALIDPPPIPLTSSSSLSSLPLLSVTVESAATTRYARSRLQGV